jgi:hypothetical protein
MAITRNCSTFLFYSKSLGASFDKTLTLGRLHLYVSKEEMREDIAKFKNGAKDPDKVSFRDEYSEPIFEILGASKTDSMDFSDYEKATIVHDLNQPVPEHYKKKFTSIVDGGTIEHVFNFPVAIKNCMEMLEVGGHYVGITPANNMMGHGLYQFSPELYYNIFREENGFEVKKMVIVTQETNGLTSDWYEVADPLKVKQRVLLINAKPTYLLVLAQKKAEVPIFQKPPQQSDYQNLWDVRAALSQNKAPKNESKLKFIYRKFTPKPLKIFAHNVHDLFTKHEVVNEDLGRINAEHFKKMNI